MSLPNPSMTFTPFDPLPASQMNDLVENDQALAAGTGLDDGAITPAKLLAGTGTSWPWQTWSPSFSGLTVGSGTVMAKYKQVGKTIFWKFRFAAGAGSSIGSVRFTLPVAFTTDTVGSDGYAVAAVNAGARDIGANGYPLAGEYFSTNEVVIRALNAASTYVVEVALSTTIPFTWGNGDELSANGFYETP